MSLQKQVIFLKKKRTVNADVDVFFTEKHGCGLSWKEILPKCQRFSWNFLPYVDHDKHIFIRPTVQTNLS